jgi:hypothetical protein
MEGVQMIKSKPPLFLAHAPVSAWMRRSVFVTVAGMLGASVCVVSAQAPPGNTGGYVVPPGGETAGQERLSPNPTTNPCPREKPGLVLFTVSVDGTVQCDSPGHIPQQGSPDDKTPLSNPITRLCADYQPAAPGEAVPEPIVQKYSIHIDGGGMRQAGVRLRFEGPGVVCGTLPSPPLGKREVAIRFDDQNAL